MIKYGCSFVRFSDKPPHPKLGRVRWWLCGYCGREFEATNNQLFARSKRGGNAHCGCQTQTRQRERNKGRTPPNKLDDLTVSARQVLRVSALKGCSLTEEDVARLITLPCHYCGAVPSMYRALGSGQWRRASTVPTNGIDRKDSSIGYSKDNCVPCCHSCNMFKRDIPYGEFLDMCRKITEHNASGRWTGHL